MSQEDFYFLSTYCEICLTTPIAVPNINNIVRVVTLIFPPKSGNAAESAGC